MPNIKDLEGSISVNGDVTPITRQPVEQLNAERWPEMSVNELTDQRAILMRRIQAVRSLGGNVSVVQQLERGLAALDNILQQKGRDGEGEIHLI